MPTDPAPTAGPAGPADHGDAHDLRMAVVRLARRIRSERVAADLGDSQMSVIGLLAMHGSLTLSELSELERVTPPSITRTVAQLVEEGYLERVPSPDDGRKARVELTERGHAVAAGTRQRRDAWFSHRLDDLTPDELQRLRAALPVLLRLADS